jgi:hypothetical protein
MYRTNLHTKRKQQVKLQDTTDYEFPAHAGHICNTALTTAAMLRNITRGILCIKINTKRHRM